MWHTVVVQTAKLLSAASWASHENTRRCFKLWEQFWTFESGELCVVSAVCQGYLSVITGWAPLCNVAAEYTLRLTGVQRESKLIIASTLTNVAMSMVYNKTHLELKTNSKGGRVEEGARAFMM